MPSFKTCLKTKAMGAGRSEAPVAYAQNEEKQADDIQEPSFFIRCSTICCCFLMVRRLSNMVPHIFEAGSKPALATPPGTSSRPIFPHISSYFYPVCLQSALKCRQFMAFELSLTVVSPRVYIGYHQASAAMACATRNQAVWNQD